MYNMGRFYTYVLLFYKLMYNEYKELYYYCIGTPNVPKRFYDATVSISDFESGHLGSNPSRTLCALLAQW